MVLVRQWSRILGQEHLRRLCVASANYGLSQTIRHRTTESKVIRSPFSDVQIPTGLIDEVVWSNLERWPDKDALVSELTCHTFVLSKTVAENIYKCRFLRTRSKTTWEKSHPRRGSNQLSTERKENENFEFEFFFFFLVPSPQK